MKKIVGIMAAVAMAASVFAVDMTAGARLSGDIFTYDGASKGMSAMKIGNENQFWHKPVTLSISSDNAGATVKFTEGDGDAVKAGKWAIWFKPADALKVDLGTIDDSMNTESIAYGGRVLNYDSFGFRAAYTADALTLKVALVPGKGANFFEKADGSDAVIKELNVAANYNAGDAGTISAMFDYTGKTVTPAVAATTVPKWNAATGTYDADPVAAVPAKENPAKIAVAAGYKNSFGAVTVFADYAFVKEGANSNVVDFDVIYNEGAINAQAYVKFTAAAANTLYTIAKVNYSLDNGSAVYGKFESKNVLADKFDATIALGLTGSVGIMSYEVAPEYKIVDKKFSVPFNVAVAF